jgi:hypothetical protein
MTEDTIKKLKTIAPKTEAGRRLFAISESLRSTASLLDTMLEAASDPKAPAAAPEDRIEEMAVGLGAMLLDGEMRRMSQQYTALIEHLLALRKHKA